MQEVRDENNSALLALSKKVYQRACADAHTSDKENNHDNYGQGAIQSHVDENIGSYRCVMEQCATMLRLRCQGKSENIMSSGQHVTGTIHLATALDIIGPALQDVLEDQAREFEDTLNGLRETLDASRLEQQNTAERSNRQLEEKLEKAHKEKLDSQIQAQNEEIERLRQELSVLKKIGNAIESDLENAREDLVVWKQQATEKSEQYKAVLKENRYLHSMIKDLRGNVRIYTRIRPCGVTGDDTENIVRCNEEESTLQVYSKKHKEWRQYTFDRVFGESSTQESIYMEATSLIRSVMDGHNVTIFAYGQTGSGKTHTMQYLNKKALQDLFVFQHEEYSDMTYSFRVQLLEIYNDRVRDLLSSSGENLKIQPTRGGSGSNVPDATQVKVSNVDDVDRILEHGASHRSVGATHMNDRSSRSHQILTVMVDCYDGDSQTIVKHGCLNLIDLAGSERLDRSKAEGQRKEETKHINSSLSALGRVMNGLAEKHEYISFRDSKLTQLLEDSLSGRSKSMMFMHISPEESSLLETMSTLNFGKGIVDRVVVKR